MAPREGTGLFAERNLYAFTAVPYYTHYAGLAALSQWNENVSLAQGEVPQVKCSSLQWWGRNVLNRNQPAPNSGGVGEAFVSSPRCTDRWENVSFESRHASKCIGCSPPEVTSVMVTFIMNRGGATVGHGGAICSLTPTLLSQRLNCADPRL